MLKSFYLYYIVFSPMFLTFTFRGSWPSFKLLERGKVNLYTNFVVSVEIVNTVMHILRIN